MAIYEEGVSSGNAITELLHLILEEEEEIRLVPGKEEMIGRVMRSLEEEIGGLTANCCVQSDSAFCMTSSSSRVSEADPYDFVFGRPCRCHEDATIDDQFGYLLGASDEELGIPASPGCGEGQLTMGYEGDGSVNGSSDLQGLAVNEGSFCMRGWGDWEMGVECCEEYIGHFMGEEYSKEAFFVTDFEQGLFPCSSVSGNTL